MLVSKLEEVVKLLELCQTDAAKADKGTRSAATRLRKDLAAVTKLLKEVRKSVLGVVAEVKASQKDV